MNPVQSILIGTVRLYRWTLSPALAFIFGPLARCRYTPSCSQYALDAIKTHGAFRGGWLAVKRVCRCHPWSDCGHDPVPPAEDRGRRSEVRGQKEGARRNAAMNELPIARETLN